MAGINKAIIVGNLGKDPEVRYANNGSAIASITVATSEQWKDKTTGEKQEKTEWHRISAFGRLAEIMGEYLKKGSQVYIEGRIQTRKWQDKSGQDRYTTEIIANELQMLGSRSGGSTSMGGGGASMGGGAPQADFNQDVPQQQAAAPASAAPAPSSDFDDDIPF